MTLTQDTRFWRGSNTLYTSAGKRKIGFTAPQGQSQVTGYRYAGRALSFGFRPRQTHAFSLDTWRHCTNYEAIPADLKKGRAPIMNIASNHTQGYLSGYGYPVTIGDFSEYSGQSFNERQSFFANSGNSRYFSSNRYVYHVDLGPGLYNTSKKLEPHPMQMIGSFVDVYA